MRQVRYHSFGGPEVLQIDDVPVPQPGPNELLLEVDLIGVSLAAVRQSHEQRANELPAAPSGEVTGRVVAMGELVEGWVTGQRAACVAFGPAYAEYVTVPAGLASVVPAEVDDATAVGLARSGQVALGAARAAAVGPGDRVLITAALSGVGHLAVQIVRLLGATSVIAAVGSPTKLDSARRSGADTALIYDDLAGSDSVDVGLDGVGGTVTNRCLDLLAPSGRLVVYSAQGTSVDTDRLRTQALTVTGFSMAHLVRRRDGAYGRHQVELMAWAAAGQLRLTAHQTLPLEQAADAHRLVLTRANVGKLLLDPRC